MPNRPTTLRPTSSSRAILLFALRSQSICQAACAMVHHRSAQNELICAMAFERFTEFLEGSPPTESCCVNTPIRKESHWGTNRAVARVGPTVYLPRPNPVSEAVGMVVTSADEHGIFGRVIGPPPERDGEIAEALRAGGAGSIRVAPFQERRVYAEQVVSPERQINTGHGSGASCALREIEVLGSQLHASDDRRGVGPVLGSQCSEALRFLLLLRRYRLRPQPSKKASFLRCDLRRFRRLVHLHMRRRCRPAPGRFLRQRLLSQRCHGAYSEQCQYSQQPGASPGENVS